MNIKLPAIQIGLSFEGQYQKEKGIDYFKEIIEALSRQSFKKLPNCLQFKLALRNTKETSIIVKFL